MRKKAAGKKLVLNKTYIQQGQLRNMLPGRSRAVSMTSPLRKWTACERWCQWNGMWPVRPLIGWTDRWGFNNGSSVSTKVQRFVLLFGAVCTFLGESMGWVWCYSSASFKWRDKHGPSTGASILDTLLKVYIQCGGTWVIYCCIMYNSHLYFYQPSSEFSVRPSVDIFVF